MQKSIILKTLICGGEISLAVIDSTGIVQEAMRRHHFSQVAAAAFGRTLTASAYLCSWLKGENSSLSVTVNGGGPCGRICVAGDSSLRMRGFTDHPEIALPPRADGKLDVGGYVGRDGMLTVVSDDGTGLPFTGACALVSGEIAEDFSAYFLTSEQRPTAIALGVRVTEHTVLGAGGVFLQPLPGASEESLSYCEEKITEFKVLSSLIEERGAEGVLRQLTDAPFEARPILYRCHCTRRRAEGAVLSLGREDAHALLRERGSVNVHCQYCNTDYTFTEEDIARLFGENA